MDNRENTSTAPRRLFVSPEKAVPDDVFFRERDSSSDSSTGNTGGSPSFSAEPMLRSRNRFARNRRDRRVEMPLLSSRIGAPSLPVTPDTTKGRQLGSGKTRRRIVIGGSSFIPHRLQLFLSRASPACNLFMKLRCKYKLCFAILAVCAYITCYKSIQRARIHCFGLHPIHGGTLGELLDQANIQRVLEETNEKRARELDEVGVVLPPTSSPGSLLDIDTQAALREHLVRREARSRHLIHAEAVADVYQRGCAETNGGSPLDAIFHFSENSDHDLGSIPKHIFVPDVTSWQRSRPGKPSPSFCQLTFDEAEMRLLIADNYLPMVHTFDSLKRMEDRILLWSICALYFYGGVFLGQNAVTHSDIVETIVAQIPTDLFEGTRNHCSSPTGLAIFNQADKMDGAPGIDVFMIAATPRHPHLRCVMNQLESSKNAVDASRLLTAFYLDETWESSHTFHHLHKQEHAAPWEMLTTQCGYRHAHTQECCRAMSFHEVKEVPLNDEAPDSPGKFFVQLLDLEEQKAKSAGAVNLVAVVIKEMEGTEAPVKSEKICLEELMNKKRIAPGWLCTRCLKTSLYGTLEKCSPVCNSGYEHLMCYAPDEPEKAQVIVEVTVNTQTSDPKRIPRVIHQTWFEELSPDRYPEVVRLQNSWKRSGWEYRFYTDETARNFISENFPSRFTDAFDALIPGAYKADLFRYLVLMKEGGIYSDVDILLDASLDEFVTPSLSFFAPRDVVCEYADESFCLWNGLIGSSPGHPFMIRAVERLMNLILERADLYDMERDVCRRVGRTMENWKVRSEPLLLVSGPCALGVALNDVMQRDSLAKIDIGWIPAGGIHYGEGNTYDHGDALILVGDKFDLGSFRISDPERSYIIASTDMPGLTKDTRELSNPTRGETRRRQKRRVPLPHYSEASRGEFVWGMHNVYHDNLVNNEVLKFNVLYK